eukprot:g2893.t1
MAAAQIALPRRMLVGGKSVQQLGGLIKTLGKKKPLVVTDAFLETSGALDRVHDALNAEGVNFDTFSDTIPDPTTESVDKLVQKLKSGDFDSIVALGGGSPMDTAKAAAVLHTHGGKMSDYKAPFSMDEETIPLIAIPTTAGTGSEATKFTIVTDSASNEKMLCIGLAYLPIAAIIDYEFTMTKPWRLTADTGIDAMCHAMEAFVSKKKNPFSDSMAIQSLASIGSSLRTACMEPENHAARESMMLASTQAGIAFSNASVTLIHGLSRPIGANFHVPHGLSNAMLAPLCTKFSIEGAVDRYAEVSRALDFCPIGVSDEDAAEALPVALEQLNAELKVPSLEEFGIAEDQFMTAVPKMAVDAIASGSPGNNPVVPDGPSVLENLYKDIWASGSHA